MIADAISHRWIEAKIECFDGGTVGVGVFLQGRGGSDVHVRYAIVADEAAADAIAYDEAALRGIPRHDVTIRRPRDHRQDRAAGRRTRR